LFDVLVFYLFPQGIILSMLILLTAEKNVANGTITMMSLRYRDFFCEMIYEINHIK